MKKELREATRQQSFFGKQKLILIDEVDGMAGNADRGGTAELSKIIDGSRFPVIMTANDAYDSSIQTLRNKSKLIELGSVHTNSIAAHLKQILENEGIEYEENAVKKIARRSGGQMRSAINDLEAVARGEKNLTEENLEVLGTRDNRQEIFDALKMIFKTESVGTARDATENLDEDADTLMQWVRENIPREYKKKEDLENAYRYLSLADLNNGRIRKSMNWSLLKYVYDFSTVGVALAKKEKYGGWTRYQYPSKLKKMGQSRSSRKKLETVGNKIGDKLHISIIESVRTLPFLAKVFEDDETVAESLGLDEDEVEFVKKFS